MARVPLVLLVLVFAGCGGESASAERSSLVAAFYPLAWLAGEVAGETSAVDNLTPPGAEPHDLELSARDVERIRDASVVLYVGGGFQPALEEVVTERDLPSLDVLPAGERDPHVWLDPVRFEGIATEIGRALGRSDSARPVATELKELDEDFRRGLARCQRRELVTTHAAFGHLAKRYGLEQVALAGSSPESEPSPRDLEELTDRVRAVGATTVFAEPLASDRVARTVAREVGAQVAILDPLEGLSEERLAAGDDYLSVMRENLEALREALGCR